MAKRKPAPARMVRLQVVLPAEVQDDLRQVRRTLGISSQREVVRLACATYVSLVRVSRGGARLVLVKEGEPDRELVLVL